MFYSIGADDDESWAVFGEPRKVVFAREAETARNAFEFVQPIVDRFEGQAYLQLARGSEHAHLLHVFLPARTVMRRFTPPEWFAFWKQQDAVFNMRSRVPDSAGHA